MPSKLFPLLNYAWGRNFFYGSCGVFALATHVVAVEPQHSPAKFVGMSSCSSSSCHGGAGEKKDQCVIWSKCDFHSRAYATLTTARSERMGEILGIESPAKNASCTVCHAPFQTLPNELQASSLDITKGISCESCHAPAENWLRSHTRSDFTHADRVNVGMRDLKDLYVRANTCVACHQNVPSNLLAAGHPELIFELDGQAVSQPKHWAEAADWNGAQTWLVGQAVALREMSWQLSKTPADEKLFQKFAGLEWVLAALPAEFTFPHSDISVTHFSPTNLTEATAANVQKSSDELARKIAEKKWSGEMTQKILESLAKTSGEFSKNVSQPIQARRAERLVLGLDRLVLASDPRLKRTVDSELTKLFSLVQSLPDFDPEKFAEALKKFSNTLGESR